ncbi:hypothetical protein EBT25_04370 [bacterium]|nr:hypothetical protein [bacterium]
MTSSNSTWDRKSSKKIVSPAFIFGRSKVIFEFENRKRSSQFSFKLANIRFKTDLGQLLDSGRNSQILKLSEEGDANGYTYKSISHVHSDSYLLGENIVVLGNGSPTSSQYENCSMIGSTCADGTNTQCVKGKCRLGTLTKVNGTKWRYDSLTVNGLYYFVFGSEYVDLKTIVRGKFALPAGAGSVDIPRTASLSTRVYLPPKTYSRESYVRRVIFYYSQGGAISGIRDSVDDFVRTLLGGKQSDVLAELDVKTKLLTAVKSELDPIWYKFVEEEVENIWQEPNITNKEFAIECYSSLSILYKSAVQVRLSGIKASNVQVDNNIGRPVYDRLPGIQGTYNNEGQDTVAKWLTAGADDVLSTSKNLLDTFYQIYLDPDTCYPLNLDWIAQHLGFYPEIWDSTWSNSTKRTLIKNAHVNNTSGSMWTNNSDNDTLRKIDTSAIEKFSVNTLTGVVSLTNRYTSRVYNSTTHLTTLQYFNNLVVDNSRWSGIIPSRGSMITLLFMMWVFGIKAHDPGELEYSSVDNTYSVRSGLRSLSSTSPVNIPYSVDLLRAGDESDLECGNFPNQAVAGISTCQDELSANTIVLRMPFYYNRNGRSWDAATVIMENYSPSTAIARVQYAYAAADLAVADDIFFEPTAS